MNRITPIEDLVKKAIDEIQTISSEKAAEKINNEEYLFIDIRKRNREGKYNAYHAPRMLDLLDPSSPYFKKISLWKTIYFILREDGDLH